MATFVLVHGSFGGAWIWQKVSRRLRAGGHEVYTPGLTGLSDRAHLLNCGVDLTTHITDVTSLLFHEDLSDVVLVGHSYAGMVITGVAAQMPERLQRLIYFDAYVPDDGQSEVDLWPAEMRAAIEADEAAGRGLRPPPPAAWLGLTDPALADWATPRMSPQPLATYTQVVPRGNAKSAALPRVYVHCTAGPTAPLFAMFASKALAANWPVHDLATGHDAMLIAPDEVAALLVQIARA